MGIWLFLASEVMLFGALFSAYALLRTSAPAWPSGRATLQLTIGAINTGLLMGMTAAAWRARNAPPDAARRWIGAGTALALAFLGLKSLEYAREIHAGLLPSTSTFFATYFLLTGLHALHVAGGAVANLWAMAGTSRVNAAMNAGRFRALGLYWLFVDVVWLIIFGVVYSDMTNAAVIACAVCFQIQDPSTASAVQAGVVVLVAVTTGVLSGFAAFIARFVRRTRRLAHDADAQAAIDRAAGLEAPEQPTS